MLVKEQGRLLRLHISWLSHRHPHFLKLIPFFLESPSRWASPGFELVFVPWDDLLCDALVCFQVRSAARGARPSHGLEPTMAAADPTGPVIPSDPRSSRCPGASAVGGFGRPGDRHKALCPAWGRTGMNTHQLLEGSLMLHGMGSAAQVPMVTSPSMPLVSRQYHC